MITIGNKHYTLMLDEKCKAVSLIHKATGEECLMQGEDIALFSLTEDRPFNNEIKLAHPAKKTTFEANRVRREGDMLIVGFELLTFEAVVQVKEAENYITFTLVDYIISEDDWMAKRPMITPPVAVFRLLQLPIRKMERFGEWLNVSWNDKVAVNLLSASPYADVGGERRSKCRIMYGDAVRGIKVKGCSVALIVSSPDQLLDCIESVEEDYDLPYGVASRRSDFINKSIYWTNDINPANVEEHIAYAKKGGFSMMLIYYPAFIRSEGYSYKGDYIFNEKYPGGIEDLKTVLAKVKAAGITPGFHFLHTHIGVKSSYVTPVADHRLNLTRQFTLAKPLGTDDDLIYVEENPEDTVMHPSCRVLRFDGEIIYYDGYTTTPPYCFTGCKRGHYNTNITSHSMGTIGGILDISEFGAVSVYIDQRTGLQDEVADKIAELYNVGFEFVYYDGSEGTNAPHSFYIPYAQYRVYRKLDKKPLFCEGAAKAHFSWHMLSGGNAFDVFPMEVFKDKIAEYPLEEAPRMANDFTRLNFGWWRYCKETQPDMYEYGTSKAAAWDCPVTVMAKLFEFANNKRTEDTLEVMNRWEDIRKKGWLTKEKKEWLKDPDQEYILLIDEKGEYELAPYYQIKNAAGGNKALRAFWFKRGEKNYVVCWHTESDAMLELPLSADDIRYEEQLGGKEIAVETKEDKIRIPIAGRRYLSSFVSEEILIKAFENSSVLE